MESKPYPSTGISSVLQWTCWYGALSSGDFWPVFRRVHLDPMVAFWAAVVKRWFAAPACLRAVALGFRTIRSPCARALLSAANQGEGDAAISTANSTRMTDCWADCPTCGRGSRRWNFRGHASDAKGATSGWEGDVLHVHPNSCSGRGVPGWHRPENRKLPKLVYSAPPWKIVNMGPSYSNRKRAVLTPIIFKQANL